MPSQSDPNAPRTEPQERPRTAAFCPRQLATSSPGVPPRAILPPLRVVGRAPALDFIAFGHEENTDGIVVADYPQHVLPISGSHYGLVR